MALDPLVQVIATLGLNLDPAGRARAIDELERLADKAERSSAAGFYRSTAHGLREYGDRVREAAHDMRGTSR